MTLIKTSGRENYPVSGGRTLSSPGIINSQRRTNHSVGVGGVERTLPLRRCTKVTKWLPVVTRNCYLGHCYLSHYVTVLDPPTRVSTTITRPAQHFAEYSSHTVIDEVDFT